MFKAAAHSHYYATFIPGSETHFHAATSNEKSMEMRINMYALGFLGQNSRVTKQVFTSILGRYVQNAWQLNVKLKPLELWPIRDSN